jgi:uncharacterized glyoxalase superfamily protein PhnB
MIVAIRPFVPSKSFDVSKQFYEDLGFRITPFGNDLAQVAAEGHSFFLQNFYERHFAGNFVMHMLVTNLDEWWQKIGALGLGRKYNVRDPLPPKDEPWGLRVCYVFDPSGVLWHIAQRPR